MRKRTGKQFIEYGIVGALVLTLYLTGWHTEVIGFVQRGILATGLMNPDTEKLKEDSVSEAAITADFNFNLIDSKGKKVAVKAFKGKTVFLNLWATWCPPCIAEMPGINKLYNATLNEDIAFILISQDEDFAKAKKFVARKGFDFEIYHVQDFLPVQYQKGSIPTTFVINRKGEIVLTHKGMADYGNADFKNYLMKVE